MRKLFATMGLVGLVVLAGCQGGAMQTGKDIAQDAAVGVQRNLSDADIQKLKDACTAADTFLAEATSVTAPKTVKDVAVYPKSFCYQVITGQKNNADQSSLTWLPSVLKTVGTAAKAAGVLLPAIIPLL